MTVERDRIDKEIKCNREESENADKAFQAICLDKTNDIRKKFRSALTGFYKNPSYSQKILSTKPQDINEEVLTETYKFAYNNNPKIYELLHEIKLDIEQCDLLSEPIVVQEKDTKYAQFIKDINAISWVNEGHEKFHNTAGSLCSYCHQELPSNFEELFYSCFDDKYQDKLRIIQTFLTNYSKYMFDIYSPFRNMLKQKTLPDLKDKIDNLKRLSENFLYIIRENIAIINLKLKEPSQILHLIDINPILIEINKTINICNAKIIRHNEIVKNLEQSRKNFVSTLFSFIAYKLKDEVSKYRNNKRKYDKTIDDLEKELEVINYNLRVTRNKLNNLNSTYLNTQSTIVKMNTLLRNSGFEGFEIIKSDLAENAYKIVRENKKIAVRLSDGEIHFLAFLYFYNVVKGRNIDGTRKSKIVVIDDPVSSLDESSLFIISSLIREMIETCFYNIEHMGTILKGDYDIKQIFILTHNILFYRNVTRNQVERYKGVNFYIVNKINNHSTIKHCIRQSLSKSATSENFNPIKNAYTSLWSEYQSLNSEFSLINVICNILNYYFIDICNKSGADIREEILINNRNKFIDIKPDGTEDSTRFHLASSMLLYMSAGFERNNFVSDGSNIENIRKIFKDIFYSLGQGEHFEMMMKVSKI